ncbi:hypothetical protein SAMN05421678_102391 [Actinopolymorpha cephalotaxi]|uniref:Uncharacterized protein n=1 Tax=Actinopolymorpha cephalotaxi TaxID=504797 RepID=A0A1I2M0N2_9ACTN|nr:hypothetical protein [Actinopolymorpha cephalotaxi]NYH81529.1 hypothetical protein [Actinopolymorpha cephalotaxi]SFF84994.1 hypothetical protein SAMN05421678_102391 [Actinopolymorpha cephalotaxi]
MHEPITQRGIKIAGENPMIILYRPGSDDIVVLASMWTARYSPVGAGRALLIWADPEQSGLAVDAPIGIYTDNPELATYVWEHFYRDYDTIRGRGIESGSPVPARFAEVSGGDRFHRITCVTAAATIELEWREVLDCFQVTTQLTGFETSVVACPCAVGEVRVNGVAARGEVHQPEGWFGSSAALAFAETWREI